MGQKLGLAGIRPILTRVVGDDKEVILDALRTASADIVLFTGGLGPTKDDITKHTCARSGTHCMERRGRGAGGKALHPHGP